MLILFFVGGGGGGVVIGLGGDLFLYFVFWGERVNFYCFD